MIVVVALLLLIFGSLFWIYGWGCGEIHLMDFDAEEVSYIELYSIDSVFNCNAVAVTEKEDIQSLIDLVNSFRHCGNELKYLLSGEFGTGALSYMNSVSAFWMMIRSRSVYTAMTRMTCRMWR